MLSTPLAAAQPNPPHRHLEWRRVDCVDMPDDALIVEVSVVHYRADLTAYRLTSTVEIDPGDWTVCSQDQRGPLLDAVAQAELCSAVRATLEGAV